MQATDATLKAQIDKQNQRLAELAAELDGTHKAIEEKVLPRLRGAISETRLGPMIDLAAVKYEGGGVNYDLLLDVNKERVDENDIQVLRLWAEVLWSNVGGSRAWQDAKSLSELHKSHFPEDFDRDLLILDAHGALLRREGRTSGNGAVSNTRDSGVAKWVREQEPMCRSRIRRVVERWLDEDPVHCGAIAWLRSSGLGLPYVEQRSLFERRRRSTGGSWAELGMIYRDAKQWEDSIREFQKAVNAAPDEDTFHFMLANAYFSAEQFQSAADSYRNAIKRNDGRADYYNLLGRALGELSQWEDACATYRRALELEPGNSDFKTNLKLEYNDWGNSLLSGAKYADAAARYQDALQVDDTDAIIHSNRALALELDSTDPDATGKAIQSLTRALTLAPGNENYGRRLGQLQELKKSVPFFSEKVAKRLPVVTPVALEIAADLIPLAQSGEKLSPLMETGIRRMRESVRSRFGVQIPGLRIRGNETDLPNGTYVVLLMEIPLVSGHVLAGKLLVRKTADELSSVGIASEDATDPRSGALARWVAMADREQLKALGYEALEPVDYMLEHLQVVIERNLAEFVGVQETRQLVEAHCPEKLDEVEHLPNGWVSLTCVLRALLAEQVPIVPFALLVEQFMARCEKGASLAEIVEAIRGLPEICARLPGNDGEGMFELDEELEKKIQNSLHTVDPVPVLAMTPEDTQEALTAVRNNVHDVAHAAIVVSDPKMRAHVRNLVELEFPALSVLALEELAPEQQSKPRKRITLD